MSDEEKRKLERKASAGADPALLDRLRVDEQRKALPRRIVVLPYGWVVVGFVRHFAGEVVIENAAVVHRWGTTKGLGQLALEGPRNDGKKVTQLHPCPTIRVLEDTVVFQIDCEESAWAK